MKYLYLILILFGSVSASFAQAVAPEGAVWHFRMAAPFSAHQDFIRLEAGPDTLVAGTTAQLFYKSKEQICSPRYHLREVMYADSGRVYAYDWERTEFQLLWDYNAEPGDTWRIPVNRFAYDSTTTPVADTIVYRVDVKSEQFVYGATRRVLEVSISTAEHDPEPMSGFGAPYGAFGTTALVEGIGDTRYFFPWLDGACDFDYADGLRCYEDDLVGFFDTGVSPACDFVGLPTGLGPDAAGRALTLQPNPAAQYVRVVAENTALVRVQVYNALGQCVLDRSAQGPDITLDVSPWPAGLYRVVGHTPQGALTQSLWRR